MTRILTFLLGFYVATIMKRWWAQITGLPKIADIAMVLNGLVMEGMMHNCIYSCILIRSGKRVVHFKKLLKIQIILLGSKGHESAVTLKKKILRYCLLSWTMVMTQVNKVMFQEYGNDFSAVTKGLCTTEEINKLKVRTLYRFEAKSNV